MGRGWGAPRPACKVAIALSKHSASYRPSPCTRKSETPKSQLWQRDSRHPAPLRLKRLAGVPTGGPSDSCAEADPTRPARASVTSSTDLRRPQQKRHSRTALAPLSNYRLNTIPIPFDRFGVSILMFCGPHLATNSVRMAITDTDASLLAPPSSVTPKRLASQIQIIVVLLLTDFSPSRSGGRPGSCREPLSHSCDSRRLIPPGEKPALHV